MPRHRRTRKGLTLLELIIAIGMLVVLVAAAVYVFIAVLRGWFSQETRAGIDINLDSAMEQVTRDLREARQIQSTSLYNELRFTRDRATFYVYYLYNADDPYGPPFDSALSYQLRKETLDTSDINGTFTYGSGQIILTDVVSPAASNSPSDLSLSGNMATVDLSVNRGGETIRLRTQVRPRNL
jgi:type II secretory pathway pseudopilin PulG